LSPQVEKVEFTFFSAGGVEEDFIKCLAPTYIGDFNLNGGMLRKKGINRIGNLLVPNDNYCKFEDWIMPIFDKMLEEQIEQKITWTPSKVIRRLGLEINNKESIYYWAAKNDIPVYSPALTDGSIGDMLYFHSYRKPGLIIDLVGDIRAINSECVFAKKTGEIILGGGVVKHHINK
jgi:deoxyhypusine synthase